MDYKDGKNMFVFIEEYKDRVHSVSLELLSEARRLKENYGYKGAIVAIYLSNQAKNTDVLYRYGAEHVVLAKDPKFASYQTVLYAKALEEVIHRMHPEIVLVGGTNLGRDLAPRVSAKVQTGLTADATHLAFEEETMEFLMTRPAFGGNINATIICQDHYPKMATVRPGVFEKEEFSTNETTPTDIHIEANHESKIEVIQECDKPTSQQDITKARIVVSGGRGVSGCFHMLNDVAKSVKGEVGASRAVVDQGIAYKEMQVGQTGKTIKPTIYLACGISGAIQHTAGMDKSELIIAINTDEKAPIFQVADLGIVGDAKEILPLLNERLTRTSTR